MGGDFFGGTIRHSLFDSKKGWGEGGCLPEAPRLNTPGACPDCSKEFPSKKSAVFFIISVTVLLVLFLWDKLCLHSVIAQQKKIAIASTSFTSISRFIFFPRPLRLQTKCQIFFHFPDSGNGMPAHWALHHIWSLGLVLLRTRWAPIIIRSSTSDPRASKTQL